MMEARDFPFWATQFHPEKVAFEWSLELPQIPRSRRAVQASNYFAEFFVQMARKNLNKFPNREQEEQYLIYNYNPFYVGRRDIDFSMQQIYAF